MDAAITEVLECNIDDIPKDMKSMTSLSALVEKQFMVIMTSSHCSNRPLLPDKKLKLS